ncbi:MAG: universal stress protein [Gemmataceae bacterium]|mgnify:CR=1 FL=1
MYKHILLPIDLTDRHSAALRAAAGLAKPGGGAVTLLHVIEVIPGLGIDEEKAFYDRLRRDAEAHLDRLGETLSKAGVSWQRAVVMGQRVRGTLEEVRRRGADLIVLTGARPDPAQFLGGLGSLAMKIALLAETPVLLVKQ